MSAIVAFTGPSRLTEAQEKHAELVAGLLREPAVSITGGAKGWDCAVALACLHAWPEAHHRVLVPAAPYDKVSVALLVVYANRHGIRLNVEHVPAGREPYRARNEAMLADATELRAALLHPTFYRSGEWMTVNIARRRGIPVHETLLPAS